MAGIGDRGKLEKAVITEARLKKMMQMRRAETDNVTATQGGNSQSAEEDGSGAFIAAKGRLEQRKHLSARPESVILRIGEHICHGAPLSITRPGTWTETGFRWPAFAHARARLSRRPELHVSEWSE